MDKPYVYVEYPKRLYSIDGGGLVVENQEQENAASESGWMTAEQYHDPNRLAALKEEQELATMATTETEEQKFFRLEKEEADRILKEGADGDSSGSVNKIV